MRIFVIENQSQVGRQPLLIWENLSGDLGRLAKGSKARIKLDVDICGDEGTGAVFSGTYIVLPSQNKQY